MQGSANLNLMIKAARRAGKSLVKDFREVENLQVSTKGPGDFVTKADREAERMIKEDLLGGRPTYGWLGEETGETSNILIKLAEFYENEVDEQTKNFAAVVEPLLMIVIGAAVGFFAVSMVQPMYSMMDAI